jgi:hypothetical protein
MSGDAESAIQVLDEGLKAEKKAFAQADTMVRLNSSCLRGAQFTYATL